MTIPQEPESTWLWELLNFATYDEDTALTDEKAATYGVWWIGFIIIYIIYYLMMVVAKPKVVCSGKKLKAAIADHCPIFFECYWPPLWAFNNHIMTILRARFQGFPKTPYERNLLQLADGGQLAVDWLNVGREEADLPIVVILPGLTGSSKENYIRHLVKDGESQGFRPVVFNQRGNGGVDMLTPRTYSATSTEDLREVLDHIRSCYPTAPIVGLGVSLGAMLLTKYLAETGENSVLAGVIVISALWDPPASSDGLEQFPSKQLYNWFLSRKLRDMVNRSLPKFVSKFPVLPYNVEELLKGSVCSDFDRSCTIKVFGYSSTAEYYTDANNSNRLHLVKRPLICIQAEDDPFAPQKTLPYSRFKENENTALVTTTYGGHFGFLEGVLPFGMTWMNRAVRQSLCAVKHASAPVSCK